MPMAVGSVIEVQMIGFATNYSAMIVPHFAVIATPTTPLTGLLELRDNFLASIRQMNANQWSWNQFKWRDVSTIPQEDYASYDFNPIAGTYTGNLGFQAMAPLFAIKTANTTRNGKGRMYIPGSSPTFYLNGAYDGSLVFPRATALINGITSRYGPSGNSPWFRFGVWGNRAQGGTFYPMTEIVFRNQPGIRRTRRAHLPY